MLMPALAVATLASFLLFLVVWLRNKARLINGWLFCLFMLCAGLTFLFYAAQAQNTVTNVILFAGAFLLGILLLAGVYILIAFLLLNARLVLRRERRSLQNSLTLFLGLGLVVLVVCSFFVNAVTPPLLRALWMGLLFAVLFFFLHIFVFLVSTLLCNLARPRKNQDYIIVLGARVIDGKVTPLLKARIDKAIAFYWKQAKKRNPPVIILSGGQGEDESQSEAAAMRDYALSCRLPEHSLLAETHSTNTRENMEFSRQLMEERQQGKPYRCIYSTSNYHLLRAGIWARKAGLHCDGIGSRTAPYYLPNALLREYMGFFSYHWKRLTVLAALLFAAGFCLGMLPIWMAQYIIP